MSYTDWLATDALAIFLFHGVVEKDDYAVRNYTHKHLTVDAFNAVLGDLVDAGEPLAMDDVIRFKEGGRPYPDRSFAVTFDDGFENNLSVAAPLLRKHGVPATFYVTTNFVATNQMSWIDRIEWAFERAAEVSVRVPWSDDARTAGDAATKKRFLNEIRDKVKRNSGLDTDSLATDILAQSGFAETLSNDGPLDLKLTWDQVSELAKDSLFTIGGHSHNHVILSFLDADALGREIDTSLLLLEEKAGVSSRHYSYPEGLAYCYSDEVIRALRDRGIVCCPTAEPGVNNSGNDLFHLKRILVT